MSSKNTASPDIYAHNWDRYIQNHFPRVKERRPDLSWPGDEWGDETWWQTCFQMLIADQFPNGIDWALEIGPGSGKFTLLTLERYANAKIIGCDVSAAYLDVLRDRCASQIKSGRLFPELIQPSATTLTDAFRRHRTDGKLDAIFSIDAMVHVDLQYLVSYWQEAAQLLRPGGKLSMTVADATSERGVVKLLSDIPVYFQKSEMLGKFEWISPDIVTAVLNHLGFDVAFFPHHRDCAFVATKR
jgi:SAM-dependent methyltransferase